MAKVQWTEGVRRVTVDRQNWTITFFYDASRTDAARLQAALDTATDEVESTH